MLIFMISKLQLKVGAFFQQSQALPVYTFRNLTLDESISGCHPNLKTSSCELWHHIFKPRETDMPTVITTKYTHCTAG